MGPASRVRRMLDQRDDRVRVACCTL
jgi:hypothetical protein